MRYTVTGTVAALLLAVGGYFYLQSVATPAEKTPTETFALVDGVFATTGPISSSTPVRTPPTGTSEYRNTMYHFSLFAPSTLKVSQFDEGSGAMTITFEDTSDAQGPKGFQIFIVPYDGAQVSKEQFAKDNPSGVLQEPTNVNIGGAFGTMFFSSNDTIGETREVWFIRGGYLYEVTAPKALDAWLLSILQTWTFTT